MSRTIGRVAIRLLAELEASPLARAGYSGDREAAAAAKLHELGLARKVPSDGSYWRRTRDRSYVRGYHAQGRIEKLGKPG